MSEVKTGRFSTGLDRTKHLDLANINFLKNNYDGVKESINNFIETIEENSEPGKYITAQFDDIYLTREEQMQKLVDVLIEAGFLEQSMSGNQGFFNIDVEALHSLKSICWSAALKFGLLYE